MSQVAIGPFEVDANRLTLRYQRSAVSVGPKVVETLLALAEHPGITVSKAQLVHRVWPDGFVDEANLAQNVYVLRKLFRVHGIDDAIETIPGVGYRLRVAVAKIGVEHARISASIWRRVAIGGLTLITAAALLILARGRDSVPHAGVRATLSAQGMRDYEIGRYYWDQRTPSGVQKSIEYFGKVVDSDPSNALGYAALADASATMGDYCYGTHRPDVYFARALDYSNKALSLNPNSADAHAAAGFAALHHLDERRGVRELRIAIALDPQNADAHEWLGVALLRGSHIGEAQQELRVAARLDPLSVPAAVWLGAAAFAQHDFRGAIAIEHQALELSPARLDALRLIGQAYEAQGDFADARVAFERYGSVDAYFRPSAAVLLARLYALDHKALLAKRQLDSARQALNTIDWADVQNARLALGQRADEARTRLTDFHAQWAAVENGNHFIALVLATGDRLAL